MEPIRFFLASSTEGLEQERLFFSTFIKSFSKDSGVDFDPWTWEEKRGRYRDGNNRIQDSINEELSKSSAVFFIFYNKIGNGVREEFERACKEGLEIYVYRKKFACPSSAPREQREKFNELAVFFEELVNDNKTIIVDYEYDEKEGLEEFYNQLKKDIESFISNHHLIPEVATKPVLDAPVYDSRININASFPVNNHFVGRLSEIEDLAHKICDNETIAVYGMGGMGKTSLIAQYCRTHGSEYEKIVWVPYHNNLKDSILALGADFRYQFGRQIGFGDIVSFLNSIVGNKLIVFDNFDIDRDEINEKYNEIKQCFPTFKKVFTTRTDLSILDNEICIYNLDELKRDEAVRLFKEYYTNAFDDTQVSFSELSLFLDVVYNHALTIELVAKTLSTHFALKMSDILGYVRHESELEQLSPEKTIWDDTKNWEVCGVAITDISTKLYNMDLLKDEERRLLELLAILCEEGVDARYLMKVIAPDNSRAFEDLVNRLSTNGWVNKTGFYIKCHRILADIVLKNPNFDIDGINTVLSNLATMTSYNAIDDVASRKPYFQMQRLLLDYLSKHDKLNGVSAKLIADNAVNFCYNGATLDVENENGNGRKQSQRSSNIEDKQSYRFLVFAKQQCKENQIEICHINECLAHIYRDYYNYDEALRVLNEAKQIEETIQEGYTLDKAKTFYELADLLYSYKDRGSLASAVDYLNRSYSIYSKLLDKDCIENLDNCILYIRIFRGLDDEGEVKNWTEKAQSIIEKSNVDEHNPLRIRYYMNFSSVDSENKLYYLDKAEELTRRLYGDNHPIIGEIAQRRMMYYMGNNSVEEANNCIDQWIQNDIFNYGHTLEVDYIGDYFRLMVIFCSDLEDKWTRFVDLYNNSVWAAVDNEDSSSIQSDIIEWCNQMMGIALYKAEQFEKAIVYLKKALDLLTKELFNYDFGRTRELLNTVSMSKNKSSKFLSKLLGEDEVLTIVNYMVECFMYLNKPEDAMELLELMVAKDYVKDAYSRRQITQIKGEIALLSKQNEKANQLFNESLQDTQGEELDELILSVCDKYSDAIEFFTKKEDFDEVETCYNSQISLLENRNVPKTRERLALVYFSQGTNLMDKADLEERKVTDALNHALEIVESLEEKDSEDWIVVRAHIHMVLAAMSLKVLETRHDLDLTDSIPQTAYEELKSAGDHSMEVYRLLESVKKSRIVERLKEILNLKVIVTIGLAMGQIEKYDESIELLQMALLLSPVDNVDQLKLIHAGLAQCYGGKLEFEKAEEHFRILIETLKKQGENVSNHDLADAYDSLGICLGLQGKNNEAVEAWEQALTILENNEDEAQRAATIHYQLAQVYRGKNEYEKAEYHYKENVKLLEKKGGEPGDVMADRLMDVSVMLARQEKYDECLEVTKRALSLTSEDNVGLLRNLHSNLAVIYMKKEEHEKAEEHYRSLINIMEKQEENVSNHDLADAYDDFGECLRLQGKSNEAVEVMERALTILGNNEDEVQLAATIHYHLAQVYREGEEYEKAEYHYKENVKLLEKMSGVPGDVMADRLMKVGLMLARQEKYDECLEVTKRSLSLTSEDNVRMLRNLHSNLAYIYKKKGEHEKAEEHYKFYIDIMEKQGENVSNHNLADAYDDLGVCLFLQGKSNEAVEALEHALTILGDNEDEAQLVDTIHYHLAQVYRDGNEYEKAECHYKERVKSLEKKSGVPGDVMAGRLMDVGVMLARQEKYDECLEVTKRALSLVSDDNVGMVRMIRSYLAFAYKEKGEYGNAEAHYRVFIGLLENQDNIPALDLAIAYNELGECLRLQSKNNEAVETWEHALTILGQGQNEDNVYKIAAIIHNYLAQVYQEMNQLDKVEFHKKELARILEVIKREKGVDD